jgi:hypothetical protein
VSKSAQRNAALDAIQTQEVRSELKAAVGARMELGPEMEDQVIEAFLHRIEDHIDARVSRDMEAQAGLRGPSTHKGKPEMVVAPSLALSIPLVAIAGAEAGAVGIASVMIVVLAINVFYVVGKR